MIRTEHIQSVSDFKANYNRTFERLDTTGEARAVLLSPKVFDALVQDAELARRAALIRKSIEQHVNGEYRDGFEALGDIKAKISDCFRGMSHRFILPSEVEKQVYDCALYIAQGNPARALSWLDEAHRDDAQNLSGPTRLPATPHDVGPNRPNDPTLTFR